MTKINVLYIYNADTVEFSYLTGFVLEEVNFYADNKHSGESHYFVRNSIKKINKEVSGTPGTVFYSKNSHEYRIWYTDECGSDRAITDISKFIEESYQDAINRWKNSIAKAEITINKVKEFKEQFAMNKDS